jgi:hypothetical protein
MQYDVICKSVLCTRRHNSNDNNKNGISEPTQTPSNALEISANALCSMLALYVSSRIMIYELSSLVVDLSDPDIGPSVQRQSRVRLRRPAMGVSGHESLSSSDEDESRLSPVRGCLGRGELESEMVEPVEVEPFSALVEAREWWVAELLESEEDVLEASEERVETEESRSECASVYLTVVISSSSGVRKDTRFSAGNMGREVAILRGIIDRAGLLARMETRLCGCL